MNRSQPSYRVLLVIVALIGFCGSINAEEIEQKTYSPADCGFKVEAPASWKSREVKGQVVMLLTVDHAAPDHLTIIPTFNVVVTPSQSTSDRLGEIVKAICARSIKETPDAVFTDAEETVVDGVKAMRHVYTRTLKGMKVKGFHVLVVRNSKLYLIGFYTDPSLYTSKLAEAQKVINSWKWTD